MMEMNEEFEEFKVEILEMLDKAEQCLLQFDQLPDNTSSKDLYDDIFRSYHNIKGAAGMMEWEELQGHIHELETTLMQSKEALTIPKHLIGWFLQGNDATRLLMNGDAYEFDYSLGANASSAPVAEGVLVIEQKKTAEETQANEELPAELFEEVEENLEQLSIYLTKFEDNPCDVSINEDLYRAVHTIRGAVQLFGLADIANLATAMEESLAGPRREALPIESGLANTLVLCVDMLRHCMGDVENPTNALELSTMCNLIKPYLPKTESKSENAMALVEPVDQVQNEVVLKDIPKKAEVTKVTAKAKSGNEPEKVDSSIRVQVSLLDRLMTLMGEMVLVRNQVLQYSSKTDDLSFLSLSQKLDAVTSELQDETMKTRMQPIGNILSKFQRVVRDLSNSLGKKINLELVGVETELDKSLIEAVKDPLTHVVRNACDHGIEPIDQRLSSGKSETGTITIKAFHEGGQVIVEVSDDGKGLCSDKLIAKAIERGVIDEAKAERMSERDIQALIFAPGFSTAEKVTNVSGRGVGMDVVKSNIEKIGGLVDISSREGEGTKITLKIPLTLAIVPAMVVRSGTDRFAIPQMKLVELVRAEKNTIEFVQGKPVYRLRGNILPLLDFKKVLDKEMEETQEIFEESTNIVVLNSDGHQFGLLVDEILDTADIVVKPLAKFLKNISIYSGATVLGDGSIALILDILGIAQRNFGQIVKTEEKKSSVSQSIVSSSEKNDYVLIGLGSKTKHAIPLSFVNRLEEVSVSSIELSGHQRVVRYRGGVLKLVNLNEVLGYESKEVQDELIHVIVINQNGNLIGIEVDRIFDVLSTSDAIETSSTSHEAIIGNIITENEIVVLVDVLKVCRALMPHKSEQPHYNTVHKVLLIEDSEVIRNKIAKDLVANGYNVITAVDGVDGLRKILENRADFHLIISDLELPKMNGYDFAKKVRSVQRLKEIPMVALSATSKESVLEKAIDAGFDSFFEKGQLQELISFAQELSLNYQGKAA